MQHIIFRIWHARDEFLTVEERNRNCRERAWPWHYCLCHWIFTERKLRFYYQVLDSRVCSLDDFVGQNINMTISWLLLSPCESNKAIDEQWQGPTRTYYGTFHPKAPNFATFLGPMTGLGHNSIIFMIECQAQLLINALREMWDNKGSWSWTTIWWPPASSVLHFGTVLPFRNKLFSKINRDQGRSFNRICRRMESKNR